MRVLLLNNCHYRRGGADVVYLDTGKLLQEKGHDVAYFSTSSARNEPSAFSEYFVRDVDALKLNFIMQVIKMPRKLYSFGARKKLKDLIAAFKPDIAHIHLYKGGLTASILPVLKEHRIPAVITLHDYSLLCPRNIFVDGDGKICERCLHSSALSCVVKRCNRKKLFFSVISYVEYEINNSLFKPATYFNRIICVCKFNLEKHQRKEQLRSRLSLLCNFTPEILKRKPVHEKGDYFLFFGRLKPIKGILTLIESWKKVNTNIKLKVAGEGFLSDKIERIIHEEGLTNVELIGYKTGMELEDLIKHSSFIIVPSECYENNPLTIIEGYSFGKPVIGSRSGGIPEMVEEGRTGFTFEMGNVEELVKVIESADRSDAGFYESMSKNAREYAERNFTADNHYQGLIRIYEQAISGK
jgi:glycosyltransferase involved in cell wall biosynthesis